MSQVEINTELLYTDAERRIARIRFERDHAGGPGWEQATKQERGRYLEDAGRTWPAQLDDHA